MVSSPSVGLAVEAYRSAHHRTIPIASVPARFGIMVPVPVIITLAFRFGGPPRDRGEWDLFLVARHSGLDMRRRPTRPGEAGQTTRSNQGGFASRRSGRRNGTSFPPDLPSAKTAAGLLSDLLAYPASARSPPSNTAASSARTSSTRGPRSWAWDRSPSTPRPRLWRRHAVNARRHRAG